MTSLGGATGWLNSEPLGPAELRYPNLIYFNELDTAATSSHGNNHSCSPKRSAAQRQQAAAVR
jgi:hypothetical protein